MHVEHLGRVFGELAENEHRRVPTRPASGTHLVVSAGRIRHGVHTRVGAEPLDAPLDFAVGDAGDERPADARHLAQRARRRLRHRRLARHREHVPQVAREAVHLVRGLADLRVRQDVDRVDAREPLRDFRRLNQPVHAPVHVPRVLRERLARRVASLCLDVLAERNTHRATARRRGLPRETAARRPARRVAGCALLVFRNVFRKRRRGERGRASGAGAGAAVVRAARVAVPVSDPEQRRHVPDAEPGVAVDAAAARARQRCQRRAVDGIRGRVEGVARLERAGAARAAVSLDTVSVGEVRPVHAGRELVVRPGVVFVIAGEIAVEPGRRGAHELAQPVSRRTSFSLFSEPAPEPQNAAPPVAGSGSSLTPPADTRAIQPLRARVDQLVEQLVQRVRGGLDGFFASGWRAVASRRAIRAGRPPRVRVAPRPRRGERPGRRGQAGGAPSGRSGRCGGRHRVSRASPPRAARARAP